MPAPDAGTGVDGGQEEALDAGDGALADSGSDIGVVDAGGAPRRCEGEPVDGEEGSPCGLDPGDCGAGLQCDLGCNDALDDCSGVCTDTLEPNAFCRQGACLSDGGCSASLTHCRSDGFCYPDGF